MITKMLDNQQEYSKKIDEVYREYIFNPGSAGKVCARYILRSLGKI